VSLRARLLVGLIALTAAGLVIAGAVTYAAERSFLISRVDQVFNRASIGSFENYLDQKLNLSKPGASTTGDGLFGGPPGGGTGSGGGLPFGPNGASPPRGEGPGGQLPPPVGTYGVYIAADGKATSPLEFIGTGASPPRLPAEIPLTTSLKHPKLITVNSKAGSGLQYRVLREQSDTGTGYLVIAVPLTDMSQTLTRLRNIELIVIAGVLLALVACAWFLIRLGLRPLERMGSTARAIAAGDLSRRVSPENPRTEVGRLGLALNAMLGQIEQAFAERQASEDRLRRFISDASHELRTPLTSIRGYAELFRMGATTGDEETAKAMARIEEEAARMGVLVEDLLALARLDEMPQTRHDAVDLEPLVRDAADDARAAAPDREIAVSVAGRHVATGDPSQLRQVLANLTRNALTHTPAGTPVELSLRDADGYVRVDVRDHGPGLPQDATASVFERFWRSEGGRERGKAGAGLGLAIVAAIVDAHGGRVSASNAPGGGALFAIEIPAAAD
jgi:two-component system, OmpR family, sensor kinase